MSTSVAGFHQGPLPQAASVPASKAVAKPAGGVAWYVWAGAFAVTSSSIGGAWDVSWHRSIGRDSFWTPAHIAIYACGAIAAVICGYLIFATTFGHNQRLKDESVSVLGFRAPLGAFIAAWGGIAMITSGPFDNWWHAAYGLDVKIISPPHTLLILGIRCVGVGVMFLILAAMNRADAAGNTASQKAYQRMFLYMGGLMVCGQMFFVLEQTWDVVLHQASAYIAMGIALPVLYAVLWRASGNRWSSTITSAIYMAFAIAEILILPLFPATPKLGPVYFPVTHMVPACFPILLVVPALALDLLWQRMGKWKAWQIALVSGVVFVAVVFAVEWEFAKFLMSKAAENRFFGTGYFDFSTRPDSPERMRRFFEPSYGTQLVRGLAMACALGSIGAWVGLKFGNWMKSVQR
jgi:hypothetical protein